MKEIRVLVVDDSPLVRKFIVRTLNDEKDIKSSSYHPYGNLSREERSDDFIEISGTIWGNICRRKTNLKEVSKTIQTMKK